MTKEEAKKYLPYIQAFAEGKTIQIQVITNNGSEIEWKDVKDPNFHLGHIYRVKPKSKYRPFETEAECWKEMLKHTPFGWIEVHLTYKSIASVQEKYLYLNGENSLRHYSTLFRDATFADGQPFGIKTDETDK